MSQREWYQMTKEETLQTHEVNPNQGLSWDEALDRQKKAGLNELIEKRSISPLSLLLNQFKDFMVLVLLGATLISGLLGEYLDAITIIAIIMMNGILGFIQEFRAERSLRALKELSAPMTKVIREGEVHPIPARDLVPGDIVLLESGDRVPADVRFLEVNAIYAEESALTGESIPTSKTADSLDKGEVPLGDQRNLGFMGTLITRGTGKAVVVRTGMSTEMGKIADLIQNTESQETPLQHRLEQLGKILIAVAVALTVMVVIAGILHGHEPYAMFLAGVTLAVAAIPEGLPAIVTIALALGVQRMIRRNAIVRKLPSVETLGCASVICSDKTGTLTQNKMTVTHLWISGQTMDVSGDGFSPNGHISCNGHVLEPAKNQMLAKLLEVGVLCNNASLYRQEQDVSRKKAKEQEREPQWQIKGDPTDGALVVLGAKGHVNQQTLSSKYQRIQEFPFDSERKRMTVVVSRGQERMVCTKGAPDVLIEHCSYVYWDNRIIPFTATLKAKVLAANEGMARNALRVIGHAYRDLKISDQWTDEADVENGLVFVGLAGMIDPPRKEVREAISTCRKAGIKTVMITGDHQTTAEAIARSLGMIPQSGGLTVSGAELSLMDDQQLDEIVDKSYVFARVSPEHKLRIVKSLQRKGHVVAMTGDGVNDAPAIKAADIGIAMGISGTDVSKEASALILNDDNFSTIVAAIEEGRGIYENIRKFIRYLLASNVGEILTMFIAMMAGLPLPLVPIQILWVNLVTDGLPAMALGVDQAEKDLMQHKPRPAKENIFARRLGWKIISRGVLIGLCTLGAFWLTLGNHGDDPGALVKAQTVAFATLVLAQLIHVFDCRSSRSIFHRNILQNRSLVLAVLSSLILLLIVLYMPDLQPIFKTTSLNFREWCLVFVAAGIPTFVMGIGSVTSGSRRRKKMSANVSFR